MRRENLPAADFKHFGAQLPAASIKNEIDETVTEHRSKIFKKIDKTEISSAANMRCSSVCLSWIMSFTTQELSMFLINTKKCMS